MADDSGVPGIPTTTNWSEWTFEQALAAVTGEGADLHAAADADWFAFNSDGGEGDAVSYHAFGDYYFAVNFNQDAISKWQQGVGTIDGMMNDVAAGKRGEMDLQTLRDLEMAIRLMSIWFDGNADGMHSWAGSLDSHDSGFKGKAAYLIQWRLKQAGDGFDDTYQQLTTRHGAPIADAIKGAGDALQAFNTSVVNAWNGVSGLRDTIVDHLNFEVKSVMDYIKAQGIVKGEPNYVLDGLAFIGDADGAKEYIKQAMAKYPLGDLSSAGTWSAISDKVTKDVTAILKGWLDPPAQTAIAALQQAYLKATSSLIEITAPPTESMPKPDDVAPGADGAGGDGSLTPPGADGLGGDGALSPPGADGAGGGGDLSPPGADGLGGDGTLSPPGADGAGGDLSPPGADGLGGDGTLSPPGADGTGAGAGLPNLAADGSGTFSPPGADGTGAGAGAGAGFLPGVAGLGGIPADGSSRTGTAGPGADGAFNEPDGAGTGLEPPGGDQGLGDLTVPPGVDTPGSAVPSGIDLPNTGGADGGLGDGGLAVPGGDEGRGFGTTSGGSFGIGPGSGTGSPGGVGLGPGGLGGNGLGGLGSGGFGTSGSGGFGGGNFSVTPGGTGGMPSPAQAAGPGVPGAPGAGSSSGAGGVPFYPPMMGGAGMGGAGGEKPQERERQTWLAEDEEIWGTAVDVGPGVIGRVEEEYGEVEEMPMTRPTRGRRRADTPRRSRPAEAGTEAVGEEATTST